MILCSFCRNRGGVTIHFGRLEKLTPYCKGFQANPLRIDWDIDDFVQFLSKQGVLPFILIVPKN